MKSKTKKTNKANEFSKDKTTLMAEITQLFLSLRHLEKFHHEFYLLLQDDKTFCDFYLNLYWQAHSMRARIVEKAKELDLILERL